jgi:hypothetical protein
MSSSMVARNLWLLFLSGGERGWQNRGGQKGHPTLECSWYNGANLVSPAADVAADVPFVLTQLKWPLFCVKAATTTAKTVAAPMPGKGGDYQGFIS